MGERCVCTKGGREQAGNERVPNSMCSLNTRTSTINVVLVMLKNVSQNKNWRRNALSKSMGCLVCLPASTHLRLGIALTGKISPHSKY